MACLTMVKRSTGLILFVLAFCVSAQAGQGDEKLRGHLAAVVQTFDRSGEAAALASASASGMKLRKRHGQETLVPLIIEPKQGCTGNTFDRTWCIERGIAIEAVSASLVRAAVPLRLVRTLAQHPQAARLLPPMVPIPLSPGLGSKVSEAVPLTNALSLQALGTLGTGVKVAVIDAGFQGLAAAVAAGEIPSSRTAVDLDGNGTVDEVSEHGVGVAEQVMDMAPGAVLYCIQIGDQVDFQNAATYCKTNNIRIVNHSMGWLNASYYNDKGFIDSIVNASHDNDGVFWSVSAGNSAERHWRGAWNGANTLFWSGSDTLMDMVASPETFGEVFLNWNQYDTVKTDLDLYVYDKNGALARSSTIRQSSNYPYEYVQFAWQTGLGPYRFVVRWYSGPKTNMDISVFTPEQEIEYPVARSSIVDPASAHGAFAVGAVNRTQWPLSSPSPEPYSSRGPTTDGRMKPDIAGPDNTTSLTYGDTSATGTSFSAPVVAGAAALLLEKYPSLTANALADTLRAMAKDVGPVGTDSAFGAGLLYVSLPPPVLTSPANGAANIALTPSLSWSAVGNAASYRVQLSTVADFASIILDDSTLTGTTRSIGPLSTSTTYYWRARSKNSRGISAWSNSWSFTTVPAAPATPTLTSPANGAIDQALSPSLTWGTVSGAATYHVQVSTVNTFASIFTQDSTLSAGAKALSGLSTSTTYYWRVRAKNAGGTSAWATAWSFTTLPAAPAVPALVSPANGAIDQPLSPTLIWGTVSGVVTYHVQVSTISTFASVITEDSTLTAATRALSGLSGGTTYYWRVRAKNSGGTSTWATAWSFATVAAAGTPVLSAPANGAVDIALGPTLSWNSVAGAATYRVQLSTSSTFSTTIIDDSTLTGTTKAAGMLSVGTVYYWRANSKNAGGTSAWSLTWSFTTIPAAPATPTHTSPANGAAGQSLSPTLTWGAVSGAATYYVQVSTLSTFASIVAEDSTLTATAKPLSGLSANATYYWRVRAKNAGGTSAWATAWTFTTIPAAPATPVLTSPSNGAVDQPLSPTLAWGTVSGAATYHVQVSVTSVFSTLTAEDSTLTAATRAISGLSIGTTYYWRVRAKNAGGTSAWSTTWNFVTVPGAPATPVLTSPINGAANEPLALSLSWGTVSGASTYHVQVSTIATFASIVTEDSTLTAALKSLSGLATSTTYYWRVRAKNTGGTSAWTNAWNFVTIPAAPAAPALTSPANGAVNQPLALTLVWGTVSGAVTYHVQVSTSGAFSTLTAEDSTLTAATKTLSGLALSTVYYWRVRAKNTGGTGAWSAAWSFTTVPPVPAAVALLSPRDTLTLAADSALFIWQKTGALIDRYTFELARDSLFTVFIARDTALADTTRQVKGLANKTSYWWRVRAHNAGGWGAFSAVRKLTVSLPITGVLPERFSLSLRSFTIPGNARGRIDLALPAPCCVSIRIYSVQGRLAATIFDGPMPAGYHRIAADFERLARGTYLVDFRAGSAVVKKRIALF